MKFVTSSLVSSTQAWRPQQMRGLQPSPTTPELTAHCDGTWYRLSSPRDPKYGLECNCRRTTCNGELSKFLSVSLPCAAGVFATSDPGDTVRNMNPERRPNRRTVNVRVDHAAEFPEPEQAGSLQARGVPSEDKVSIGLNLLRNHTRTAVIKHNRSATSGKLSSSRLIHDR